MTFYQGKNVIEKDRFITVYSNSYFVDGERIIKGTIQSSKLLEDRIKTILKEGIKSTEDVMLILAWKIGKVKHRDTEHSEKIVFAKGWQNVTDGKITIYGKKTDCSSFAQFIVEKFQELKKCAEVNPQIALEELAKEAPSGIGTVYLITLLYFISGGEIPIYDQFARMALTAIKENIRPGEAVKVSPLPDRHSSGFQNVFEMEMNAYISDMKEIFGDAYKDDRNIDRALWVYGHSFQHLQKSC